jgi:hypothetical protein
VKLINLFLSCGNAFIDAHDVTENVFSRQSGSALEYESCFIFL